MPQQGDLVAYFRQDLSCGPCLPPTPLLPKPCQLPACEGAGSSGPPATAHAKLSQCVSLPWLNCHGGSAGPPPLPDLTAETPHPSPAPTFPGKPGPREGQLLSQSHKKVLSRVGVGPLCSLSSYPGLGVATGPAAAQGQTMPFSGVSTLSLHTRDWAHKGRRDH